MKNIAEQLHDLFEHQSTFASMAASINIDNYDKKIYDFYKYPLGVSFIGIKKDFIKNNLDAFVALFMLDLHYQNDWIYSEEERQNDEQWLIERLSTNEWIRSLCDFHINDYFNLKYRNLSVTLKNTNDFQKTFLYWMPENASFEEANELESELTSTKWVYSLFPNAFYDKYFGETQQYYFFAESGVYN